MSAKAKDLSWALVGSTRDIGVERGVDLVLHALFVRWLVTQPAGEGRWQDLVSSANDEELVERFAHLDIFREQSSDGRLDVEAYRSTLRSLVEAIDQSIPTSGSVDVQRRNIADTFDETLGHLSRLGKQSGESDTPHEIARLMVALTVRPKDRVLDPACGNGTGLLVAAQAQPDVSVSGFDINNRVARRASMRLIVHGVETGNGFGAWPGDAFTEYAPGESDVVIAQPPWNVTFAEHQRETIRRLSKDFPNLTQKSLPKGDIPWLLLALDALARDGRAALVLSGSSVEHRYRDIHEHLLRRGVVEAIISLPSGVFRHTAISTTLWLLREPTDQNAGAPVLLIDAQGLAEAADKGQVYLGDAAVESITDMVAEYRASGTAFAPSHIARVATVEDLHLERGLSPRLYLDPLPEEPVAHPEPERALLAAIELANFKAFGERTSVPLAPLTLIYGANSAGKSSVVQSLLLLKQSRDSDHLVTQGSLLNVGGFRGIVHKHAQRPVQIALTYGTLPSWIPPEGTPDPTLSRTIEWTFKSNASGQGALSGTSIRFGEYRLTFAKEPETGELVLSRADLEDILRGVATGTLLYPFDARHHRGGDAAEQARLLRGRESNARRTLRTLERAGVESIRVVSNGLVPTRSAVQSRVGIDQREQGIIDSYLNRTAKLAGGVADEVTHLLDSVVWLGPLRSAPQRVYDRADTTSTPGDGRHVAIYLFDHATVVAQVNDWLKRLEVPYTLDVIPVNAGNSAHLIGDLVAIALTDVRTGVDVTPADVGFGISQVLPIVVELLSRRDSVVAIEQPETHLHPRLQARLADLFIDTTQQGGQGNQLIVETHSEHLMLRVQRRIREGSLDPHHVSVVYVDQDPDGETTVKPLRLNDQGDFLDEWPQGFFDERLDELFGEF